MSNRGGKKKMQAGRATKEKKQTLTVDMSELYIRPDTQFEIFGGVTKSLRRF